MSLLKFLPLAAALLTVNNVAEDPNVWPLPSTYTISSSLDIYVDDGFQIHSNDESEIITSAITRYEHLLFPHTPENPPPKSGIKTLNIKIENQDVPLQYGVEENYTLTISSTSSEVSLTASNVWGALHGLETFSQLIIYNFTGGYYVGYSCNIHDTPRFKHRGLLMDTSRHFQPLDSIYAIIQSMSYVKLNTLHWHIVDSQSFPFESKSYPNLWNGAYSKYERYSHNDVKSVISYAEEYGIRVIPEFDIPGHAESWCVGYPQVCPSSSCNSPLNPASNFTWELIEGLIKEITTLWFDNYVHLGGDEVDTSCWNTVSSIVDWMSENNYTNYDALQYFDEKAQNITYYDHHKQVINWVEVFNEFNDSLNPEFVTIQVWKAKSALQQVVAYGFRGILSDSDLWYLDHLDITWEQMYLNEPFENIDDVQQQELILGGEGCMWGETVDPSDIQNTVWPRLASIAERLWSPMSVNDTTLAKPRIEYLRCLLTQRGIGAAPVDNDEAREAPPQPGSCYDQRR